METPNPRLDPDATRADSPTAGGLDFDVIVVGASLAGCAAATLFARAGLSVGLVERSREPDAFKRFCTHYVQASAVPTIRRLGIEEAMLAAGALPNRIDLWCPWGSSGESPPFDARGRSLTGYNLRRQKLDPILRRLAETTPGVTMLAGTSARALVVDAGRIAGIEAAGAHEGPVRAKLVVAADGRQSTLAQLAAAPVKTSPNARFACAAYYRGLRLERPQTSLMWLDHADAAYLFPNDDDVSVAVCLRPKRRLDEFREDPSTALEAFFGSLDGAPPLDPARRLGTPILMKDYPNQWREPVHRGMALVGDAAMSIDPLWGIGCGWALQSAEWLVDATVEALAESRGPTPGTRAPASATRAPVARTLAPALEAYRRRHHRELDGHRFMIVDFSKRERLNPIERLMFTAATRDEGMGQHLAAFGARLIGPREFLAPAAVLRAVAALFKRPRLPVERA